MAGYSGTPLARKLGIKDGARVYVAGAPSSLAGLLEPWPMGAVRVDRIDARTDLLHLFESSRAIALPMGLVDMKVCAVDEVWSGLKLVIRKELRAAR